MRKLTYQLYIGSYNNKLHAYVHVPSDCFKIIKNNVNIKKNYLLFEDEDVLWKE